MADDPTDNEEDNDTDHELQELINIILNKSNKTSKQQEPTVTKNNGRSRGGKSIPLEGASSGKIVNSTGDNLRSLTKGNQPADGRTKSVTRKIKTAWPTENIPLKGPDPRMNAKMAMPFKDGLSVPMASKLIPPSDYEHIYHAGERRLKQKVQQSKCTLLQKEVLRVGEDVSASIHKQTDQTNDDQTKKVINAIKDFRTQLVQTLKHALDRTHKSN